MLNFAARQVEVHYVGTLLDGTKFDSSRDRSEPFKFKLRGGQVRHAGRMHADLIKGWEEAVESMKKGEVAQFTIKPEYAYGTAFAARVRLLPSLSVLGSLR